MCVYFLYVIVGLAGAAASPPEVHQFDVVVYGGTSAGVMAAVEVARSNRSVVIVGPDQHLGGLTASGLGWTDTGNKAVIGGLARDFYHRIWDKYQADDAWRWQPREQYGNRGQGTAAIGGNQRTMWIFEPHVAEEVFEDLVREYKVPVHRDQWLDRDAGVTMQGSRIQAIRMVNGTEYQAKMFVDATYEGDLLAAAGVDYHVGREANSVYDEEWNGIQVGTLHHKHWFQSNISAYKTPGDPSSGLLPRISPDPPGRKGDGDSRIQAYCYRMCLTKHSPNRIPFVRPEGYDPEQYELLLRVLESEWREIYSKFDPIPNLKTDTNNHGPFSTDNIGMNYDYPEATYERRAEILDEHRQYQQGMLYFLSNDPRVPADVRNSFAEWGLAKDEFTDNEGWPHQIYVRESRRLIGEYVMTEHDVIGPRSTPKSVGMGSYTMDSHNVQRYVTEDGYVQNEGDIGVGVPRPYQVSYDSLVPKKSQCQNLLVPVCVSSSHIAFGSIRMEPVFMILGQSAAAGACMAIDTDVAVQDVSYERLAAYLEEQGQVLSLQGLAQGLTREYEGVVIDDSQASLIGAWAQSTSTKPFVGLGYLHDGNTAKGKSEASFRTELEDGIYEIRVAFSKHENRATNVLAEVESKHGRDRISVNQRAADLEQGLWFSLGKFHCAGESSVTLKTAGTDGYVIADAVQWLRSD